MRTHLLYLTVRVEVQSHLNRLSDTIQEFEQDTDYYFSDTENVKVVGTELLQTEPFNPLNP